MRRAVKAVLFDLDGTLIDSAPDLAGAINDLRALRGLTSLPFLELRPWVGTGARGMVGVGFGVDSDDTRFQELRDAFLCLYEDRQLRLTRVFPGMASVIDALDLAGIPWAIVTNKATRFAWPIAKGLALAERAATLVAGDTTPYAKPHPEPLFEACRRMNVDPKQCMYVGDDRRDVEAGKAAGMYTVAARWGYWGAEDDIAGWGSDEIVDSPERLLKTLNLP